MPLYRRHSVYWIEFKHAGERFRLTTGETNFRRAEKKARQLRAEIEKTVGSGRRTGVTLEMLQALDIARVRSKGMKRRETGIANIWSPVLRVLGPSRDVSSLTVGDISDYEGTRREEEFRGQKIRGQTIRREVQAIRRGMVQAKKAGMLRYDLMDWSQVDSVKSDPPSKTMSGKLWTANEIEAVFAKLSTKAVRNGVRQRLRFIQLTGLRFEELCRFNMSWIHRGVLCVPHDGSKTQQARMIPLSKEALSIAKKLRGLDARSPNKALKLASHKAGFTAVLTPRDLRVFFITHAGRTNLAAARDLAGHTNIATTSRYLKSDFRSVLEAAQAAQKASKVPTAGAPQRKRAR